MEETAEVFYKSRGPWWHRCRADTDSFHSTMALYSCSIVVFAWLNHADLPSDPFCVAILFSALLLLYVLIETLVSSQDYFHMFSYLIDFCVCVKG